MILPKLDEDGFLVALALFKD
jgi:hypothetical protein